MSIERMIRKITRRNFENFSKWTESNSNTNGASYNKKIQAVRKLLVILSGDEVVEMLIDTLTDSEAGLISAKYSSALTNISEVYRNSKAFKTVHKRTLLFQIKKSGIDF